VWVCADQSRQASGPGWRLPSVQMSQSSAAAGEKESDQCLH